MQASTQAILDRFAVSWNETSKYFDELIAGYSGFKRLEPIRTFISEMETNGGKNLFRLGTSMDSLMISRSVNHGLRYDQKFIRIEAFDNSFYVTLRDGDKTFREYLLTDLHDRRMANLLKTLKDTLID